MKPMLDQPMGSETVRVRPVPDCGHPPTHVVLEMFPITRTVGDPVCSVCDECMQIYGTDTPEEDVLAQRIGRAALVKHFMFIPMKDIENLPSSVTISLK